MNRLVDFTVVGLPATAGSKRAYVNQYTGKAAVIADNKRAKPWMACVHGAAQEAMAGRPPTDQPVELLLVFTLPRPKGHYGTGRNAGTLKDSAPKWHVSRPDLTKLVRCTEDAMSGVVWRDDSQVVSAVYGKRYDDICPVGVYVEAVISHFQNRRSHVRLAARPVLSE